MACSNIRCRRSREPVWIFYLPTSSFNALCNNCNNIIKYFLYILIFYDFFFQKLRASSGGRGVKQKATPGSRIGRGGGQNFLKIGHVVYGQPLAIQFDPVEKNFNLFCKVQSCWVKVQSCWEKMQLFKKGQSFMQSSISLRKYLIQS